MKYLFIIIILFSFSAFSDEFKSDFICTNYENPSDIIKFKKEVFDWGANGPNANTIIDDNGVIKQLEYYRYYDTGTVYTVSYWDTTRGSEYRFNFTKWGERILLGYDIPENDEETIGLDYTDTHQCKKMVN